MTDDRYHVTLDNGVLLTASGVIGEINEGDKITMTTPWWEKRKWWQFWRPKWTEHPTETRVYRVDKCIHSDRLG